MELKDYISQTIVQIIAGVQEAQNFAVDNGAVINGSEFRSNAPQKWYDQTDGQAICEVDFDIFISTTENDSAKGGIGIYVGSLGVGVQGSSGFQNNNQNRIKFSVPIKLPIQKQDRNVHTRTVSPIQETFRR